MVETKTKHNEPVVTINGKTLTPGQAMTVRVAINGFLAEVQHDDYLGTDQHGLEMTRLYRKACNEINEMIVENGSGDQTMLIFPG